MRISSSIDKKELQRRTNPYELSLWEVNRPFMSDDFSNNVFIHDLLPIGNQECILIVFSFNTILNPLVSTTGGVPRSSQEKYLVKDVIQCLLGFNGKYIRGERMQNQRNFNLEPSICRYFMIRKTIFDSDLVLK